ncbi:MAG: 4-alpha-glucanotransferase [Pyrinomonadaceae bacterium]|nr:4-alpha-glucanotransferase [Pyrinomonadaceae bacterium]MBP6211470.1 4-alpha-glucanotransferase [Pyrinomonadaceae bacterium]
MAFPRASGILLHPTSLPGDCGIGDLGDEAFRFIDFLVEARQQYWQILPLGPTGYGDSPYQCFSAFAGNTLLISPEKLIEDGLITPSDLDDRPDFTAHKVDFGSVYNWKNQLLPKAYDGFHRVTSFDLRGKFETFCQENDFWLDDYALFRAIKATQDQKPWYEWPAELKLREGTAMRFAAERLYEETQAQKFYQFLFFRQWMAVKDHANRSGIKIIGDIPIFVAADSADVWCNQNKFKLSADGTAKVVAGVPPDYFSSTGQLWGNPIYDWDAMRADGFRWWIARVHSTFQTVDVVRVDHFRGFAASWEVPGDDETAENGRWVDVPGKELFVALRQSLGELAIIAEDLGVITPDVEELRDGFGFPGMRILQFAFGGDAQNHDLPHNYIRNCVAYTGTHDNDTTVGWFNSQAGAGSTRDEGEISREHDYCLKYLDSNGEEIHWDFIRAVWASVANTAITPLPDLLGIGTEGRMNLPASTSGNWHWRMTRESINDGIVERLKELTEIYGRTQ